MRTSSAALSFRLAVVLIALVGLAALAYGLRSRSIARPDDGSSPPLPKSDDTVPRR